MSIQDQYIAWIRTALDNNPRLSQAGLARAWGKNKMVVTRLLQGARDIKVEDVPVIAQYLGVPVPNFQKGTGPASPGAMLAIAGRIGEAWYEKGRGRSVSVADVQTVPALPDLAMTIQVAYRLEVTVAALGLHAGDILLCSTAQPGHGRVVVTRRERAGFESLSLATMEAGKPRPAIDAVAGGVVIADVVESRHRW